MLVTVLCGFMTICCGVFLLHTSREMAESGVLDTSVCIIVLKCTIGTLCCMCVSYRYD